MVPSELVQSGFIDRCVPLVSALTARRDNAIRSFDGRGICLPHSGSSAHPLNTPSRPHWNYQGSAVCPDAMTIGWALTRPRLRRARVRRRWLWRWRRTEVESGWFSRMPRRVRLPCSVRSVSTATLLRSTQGRPVHTAGHSSLDDDLEGIPRAPGRTVESTYIHRVRTRSAPATDPYIIKIGRADVDRGAARPMRILGGPEVATVSC